MKKRGHVLEHFQELKTRFLKTLGCFALCALGSYYFAEDIFQVLLTPYVNLLDGDQKRIIYTGLAEVFFSYIKLACFSSFILTLPVAVYQVYSFIVPGLFQEEKQIARIIFMFAPMLFFAGGLFVFFFVIPKAWQFFLGFEIKNTAIPLLMEAKISEYLSLVMSLIIAFGVAFQLPIAILILVLLGVITSQTLKNYRRFAIVAMFFVGGVLTPPDVISQVMLAIPMILLYEISILLSKFIEKKREKQC